VNTEARTYVYVHGGDLSIIDTDKQRGNSKLIILDTTQLGKHKKQFEQIAVFRKWAYWIIVDSDEIEEASKSVEELTKEPAPEKLSRFHPDAKDDVETDSPTLKAFKARLFEIHKAHGPSAVDAYLEKLPSDSTKTSEEKTGIREAPTESTEPEPPTPQ